MWTKLNVLIENAEKAKTKETRKTTYRHRSSNNYLLSVGQKEGPYLILKESKISCFFLLEHSKSHI